MTPGRSTGWSFSLLLRSHKETDADSEEEADEHEIAADSRISVGTIDDPELGQISISAIALKRKLPDWLRYSNNRVFHALNGQVQFKQTRGYLTDCGFPALKDRVVIIVDASHLSFAAHNDIWKGDREHIRNTIIGERYREAITAAIKDSAALKALQLRVAREEMERASKTERNDLFQKLLDKDPTLANLLTGRNLSVWIPQAGNQKGGAEESRQFEGKYSPTYFKLEEKLRENGLDLPINRAKFISARSDAENGYLDRPDNPGRLAVPEQVASRFAIRTQIHDGKVTIHLDPLSEKFNVGEKFRFRLGFVDPAMPAAVEDEMYIRIVREEVPQSKLPSKKSDIPQSKTERANANGGSGNHPPTHGLPSHRLLTKDGRNIGDEESEVWPQGFTEQDGGMARDLGDSQIVYLINYDNAYHLKYKSQTRGDIAKDVITEKYVLGMRILMLGYEQALRAFSEVGGTGIGEFTDEFRRMAARGAASTVLALGESLPKIVVSSSVGRDAE